MEEEELNEDELEERLYAMLHYANDESLPDTAQQSDSVPSIVSSTPRRTVRRYWRTSGDQVPSNSQFQKVNTTAKAGWVAQNTNKPKPNSNVINKPKIKKNETKKSPEPVITTDLSTFDSPLLNTTTTKIQILDNDKETPVLDIETSDEDEVIEVAIPPKPTITIESSDEDEVTLLSVEHALENGKQVKPPTQAQKPDQPKVGNRDSTSPVPSVVSSVSDEFIRGDCIALNISSRRPNNHSFDFSLHGSDLVDKPLKKKKKKKNKERSSITPTVNNNTSKESVTNESDCFATPKNKSKNKKNRESTKVTESTISNSDIFDSDSNQSMEHNKSYICTDKSLPSADIYESDSSLPEFTEKNETVSKIKNKDESQISNCSVIEKQEDPKSLKNKNIASPKLPLPFKPVQVIDVKDDSDDDSWCDNQHIINENIVMANVTGFEECEDSTYDPSVSNLSTLGSTNIPAILNEDLDFDNLKGKCNKKRPYSLKTLRVDMEKFYNESWGGENFNHMEIMKTMSRDKSLWVIDPKDKTPFFRRKNECNYCNRYGHRGDNCPMRPLICKMCGIPGHNAPRCPNKLCLNCGAPNHIFSSVCRNCHRWNHLVCSVCSQMGHPASHCPDLWRRYHSTIDNNTPLVECKGMKSYNEQYCSGCTRRGHLVHTCRTSLPFTNLPQNTPMVISYQPVYPITNNYRMPQKHYFNNSNMTPQSTPRNFESNKRQSKSPIHETHKNKKKSKESLDKHDGDGCKDSTDKIESSENCDSSNKSAKTDDRPVDQEKAPDFIPISSTNHNNRGQIIQDNQVSYTSSVVTSARIYVTNDVIEKFKTTEGGNWLAEKTKAHNVTVNSSAVNLFLNITGTLEDQEAFLAELRDWSKTNKDNEHVEPSHDDMAKDNNSFLSEIPSNRNNVLRKLSVAFQSLQKDLIDPKAMFKELKFLQKKHQMLINTKEISPQKLKNSRKRIKDIFSNLNRVLIGQAGLAGGSRHLNELMFLQKKVTDCRNKHIPMELRREIFEHYQHIFSGVPRNDYEALINSYYNERGFDNRNNTRHHMIPIKKKNYVQDNPIERNWNPHTNTEFGDNYTPPPKKSDRMLQSTLRKWMACRNRLNNARPAKPAQKKTRLELMRKLQSGICMLDNKHTILSKQLKKMNKIQHQAQQFLQSL